MAEIRIDDTSYTIELWDDGGNFTGHSCRFDVTAAEVTKIRVRKKATDRTFKARIQGQGERDIEREDFQMKTL